MNFANKENYLIFKKKKGFDSLNQKSIAKIYNQKGQIIDSYVISKGKEKINTIEYKPGLYFITMNYAENRKTYKLIKY